VARYTFGDEEPAVRRLGLVAEAYEPVSRAFLEAGATAPGVVVDAGCGPGFSTDLLARTYRPADLIGLDASDAFLAVARARCPQARFVTHDVTEVPFPAPPADVIYGRLVLAHLPDPPAVVERWRRQLAPGGVVLSEELEAIEAPPGPLRDYDELSSEMVRRGGGVMCAGPLLAGFGGRCVPVVATPAQAARIYLFNVRRWRGGPEPGAPQEELARLERGLLAAAAEPERRDGPTMAWIVRQTVVGPPVPGA
jgi:trans-aconitate 2-methyltransferase